MDGDGETIRRPSGQSFPSKLATTILSSGRVRVATASGADLSPAACGPRRWLLHQAALWRALYRHMRLSSDPTRHASCSQHGRVDLRMEPGNADACCSRRTARAGNTGPLSATSRRRLEGFRKFARHTDCRIAHRRNVSASRVRANAQTRRALGFHPQFRDKRRAKIGIGQIMRVFRMRSLTPIRKDAFCASSVRATARSSAVWTDCSSSIHWRAKVYTKAHRA